MRILIATDAFPPVCGGSGWSTYELARGLRARGHEPVVVQPIAGAAGAASAAYDGFQVRQIRFAAPNLPFVRNYFKNERLTARLDGLFRRLVADERIDLVQAQHVLTAPPAVAAASAAGIPVVCTVRDYWPICYWSTLIHDYEAESLCPACTPGMMTRCIRPRAGSAWPLALPLIPYMRGNLRRKQRALGNADAIVAVSSAIRTDLEARVPAIRSRRVETIPNPVGIAALEASVAGTTPPLADPYAVFVGKLAHNKGVHRLLPAVRQAGLDVPLVVVGDGPERGRLEADARAAPGRVIVTGWLSRDETLRWLRHAMLLVFPSFGPESLSRVLIEAGALGVATAAMETGGTRDIVRPDETGLLSRTVDGLARDIARLRRDAELRARLGAAARAHVRRTFDAAGVVAKYEALYRELAGGSG